MFLDDPMVPIDNGLPMGDQTICDIQAYIAF